MADDERLQAPSISLENVQENGVSGTTEVARRTLDRRWSLSDVSSEISTEWESIHNRGNKHSHVGPDDIFTRPRSQSHPSASSLELSSQPPSQSSPEFPTSSTRCVLTPASPPSASRYQIYAQQASPLHLPSVPPSSRRPPNSSNHPADRRFMPPSAQQAPIISNHRFILPSSNRPNPQENPKSPRHPDMVSSGRETAISSPSKFETCHTGSRFSAPPPSPDAFYSQAQAYLNPTIVLRERSSETLHDRSCDGASTSEPSHGQSVPRPASTPSPASHHQTRSSEQMMPPPQHKPQDPQSPPTQPLPSRPPSQVHTPSTPSISHDSTPEESELRELFTPINDAFADSLHFTFKRIAEKIANDRRAFIAARAQQLKEESEMVINIRKGNDSKLRDLTRQRDTLAAQLKEKTELHRASTDNARRTIEGLMQQLGYNTQELRRITQGLVEEQQARTSMETQLRTANEHLEEWKARYGKMEERLKITLEMDFSAKAKVLEAKRQTEVGALRSAMRAEMDGMYSGEIRRMRDRIEDLQRIVKEQREEKVAASQQFLKIQTSDLQPSEEHPVFARLEAGRAASPVSELEEGQVDDRSPAVQVSRLPDEYWEPPTPTSAVTSTRQSLSGFASTSTQEWSTQKHSKKPDPRQTGELSADLSGLMENLIAKIAGMDEEIDGLRRENQALKEGRDEEILKIKDEVRKEVEARVDEEMNARLEMMLTVDDEDDGTQPGGAGGLSDGDDNTGAHVRSAAADPPLHDKIADVRDVGIDATSEDIVTTGPSRDQLQEQLQNALRELGGVTEELENLKEEKQRTEEARKRRQSELQIGWEEARTNLQKAAEELKEIEKANLERGTLQRVLESSSSQTEEAEVVSRVEVGVSARNIDEEQITFVEEAKAEVMKVQTSVREEKDKVQQEKRWWNEKRKELLEMKEKTELDRRSWVAKHTAMLERQERREMTISSLQSALKDIQKKSEVLKLEADRREAAQRICGDDSAESENADKLKEVVSSLTTRNLDLRTKLGQWEALAKHNLAKLMQSYLPVSASESWQKGQGSIEEVINEGFRPSNLPFVMAIEAPGPAYELLTNTQPADVMLPIPPATQSESTCEDASKDSGATKPETSTTGSPSLRRKSASVEPEVTGEDDEPLLKKRRVSAV